MAATEPGGRRRRALWQPAARTTVLWLLTLLTVAALAIDAYIHADLAPTYDPISHNISQGDLFRIEAGASSLAALLLIRFTSRLVWAFAAAVLASALGCQRPSRSPHWRPEIRPTCGLQDRPGGGQIISPPE